MPTIRVATGEDGVEIARVLQDTKNDSQPIEVEVLEVDGVTLPPRANPENEPRPGSPWQQWQGHVTRLDSRWWPLWVILGILALVLLLTFGLVIGLIYLIFRLLTGLARAIFG